MLEWGGWRLKCEIQKVEIDKVENYVKNIKDCVLGNKKY